MGRITIEVDETLLHDALACYVEEEEWSDYAGDLDNLAADIINNNDEVKKWADQNRKENNMEWEP